VKEAVLFSLTGIAYSKEVNVYRKTLGCVFVCVALIVSVGAVALADTGPEYGGTLLVGLDQDPVRLDPHISYSRYDQTLFVQLYDPLIVRTGDGVFHPALAESWSMSDDGRTWTFKLRDDVVFHDGTPFNAEAVKFNFDRIVDPATKAQSALTGLGPFDRCEVVDEYTINLIMSAPYPPLIEHLSTYYMGMVSPAGVEKYGEDFFRHPVGTGPFMFESWPNKERINLVRNPDYNWAPDVFDHHGTAYLEKLQFQVIYEGAVRVASLETGQTQLITATPPQDVPRLEAAGFGVAKGIVPGQPVIYMLNTGKAPCDEIAVRKAINYAVDQDAIINMLFFNAMDRAYGPMAPTTWAYWPGVEDYYLFDSAAANSLLDEAGWVMNSKTGIREKNGEALHMLAFHYMQPELGTAIQSQLKDVGIELVVREGTIQEMEEYTENCRQDAIFMRFIYADPSGLEQLFHSSQIPIEGRHAFGLTYYASPELDALLETGAAELDDAKRRAIYYDIQKLIMDNALILPLYVTTQIVAMEPDVKGLKFEGHQFYEWFYDVYLER